jgi:nicotinamide-nucleotide amidase
MADDVEAALGEMLAARQLTLAVAESCTGGLLGQRITSVGGSSGYFLGGIISYSDSAKIQQLGVKPETLERDGAVSAEAARQMARGVCRVFGAHLGISITGIAGPEGGSVEKPVGLVFVCVSFGDECDVKEFRFGGGREDIRQQAGEAALELATRYLLTSTEGMS